MSHALRELHVIVPGALSQRTGGYRYDAHVVEELRDRGWEVSVHELSGAFPGPDASAESALRAALEALSDGALVVIDGLAGGGLPRPIRAQANRLQLIALVHHPLSDETGIRTERASALADLERAALSACRGVIVTSRFTARRVEAMGIPSERIVAVPPGVEGMPTTRAPSLGPGIRRILCVGAVTPRKGQLLLVRALARIDDPAWRCVMAGSRERDPDYAGLVAGEIQRHCLGERVELPGEVDDETLGALYRSAHIFVLPSWYEGYGMVLSEAMMQGLPIVSTTGGAIPETVPEGAGILVPPGDVAALQGALERVLSDEGLRASMAAVAHRHAQTLPGWAEFGRALESALERLVSIQPATPAP